MCIVQDICEEAFDVERKEFRTRIAELEAENKNLREALGSIIIACERHLEVRGEC